MGLDLPPVPVAAAFTIVSEAWSVTFDRPLAPGALDPANWNFVASGFAYAAADATAAGNVVSGFAIRGLPDFGFELIDYTPPPFDVTSPLGAAAAGFLDFPLDVT